MKFIEFVKKEKNCHVLQCSVSFLLTNISS